MYKDFVVNSESDEYLLKSKEGKFIPVGGFQGQSIAVLTSGGDSQGMNAAVKSAVRMGLYCGATVYFVFEGLQGLIDGGLNIREAYWADVSGMIHLGGTVIGSARCMDFKTRPGRLKAAKNLIDRNISNLVVIGGDGSLTGANMFKQEWLSYVDELIERKVIDPIRKRYYTNFNIVGLVGSIDNDFCGTDMTIGVNSALTRIMEATDSLITTAHSHQRCFVIEVMGRHCGYLALITAISSEAQFVFIPEKPPPDNWEIDLCKKLEEAKLSNRRVNLVIVSEGAIDTHNKPITANYLKNLITDKVHLDTRITVLGHVQRGGNPTSFDRILALRQGAEAVNALIDNSQNPGIPACVICIVQNNIVRRPLMECVLKTQKIQQLMDNGKFEELVQLRGAAFLRNYKIYETLNTLIPKKKKLFGHHLVHTKFEDIKHSIDTSLEESRIGVICVGSVACGMNASIRSVVRMAIANDLYPIGIKYGFEGLIKKQFTPLFWNDVRGIISMGGTIIGSRRMVPTEAGIENVAKCLAEIKICGLVIIGGFEAFLSGQEMWKYKGQFDQFRIPVAIIPTTITNNIPGISFTVGNDTSLNIIVNSMDNLKLGSLGTQYRIYILEVMGKNCGYLNTMSALIGGADLSYIDEEKLTIDILGQDVNLLKTKMFDHVEYGIVLRTNVVNHPYDALYISKLFKEEGQGIFNCRYNSIGHVSLGGFASSFDRNLGTKLGVEAVIWIKNMLDNSKNSKDNIVLIGLSDCGRGGVTPIYTQFENTDYKKYRPKSQWWMKLRPLLRIIQTHPSRYDTDYIMKGVER